MKSSAVKHTVLVTLAGLLAAGCATSSYTSSQVDNSKASPAPPAAIADASRPIWIPVNEPLPLSAVVVMSGVSQTVDLTGCVSGDIATVEVIGVDGASAINVAVKDACTVEVSAPRGKDQQGVANLRITTKDGKTHNVGFPVIARNKSLQKVSYKSDPAKKPKKVFIAGQFNGWNDSANALKDDDGDGVWTAELPIEPGEWPYKFVVDGEWILDPANSNVVDDGGGHQNSNMVIEGVKTDELEPLHITMLPANAPGVGWQGGFKVDLSEGGKLDAVNVKVFVNNAPLAASEYQVNADTGVINLAAPSSKWSAQQFVSIVATESTGRFGSAVEPFEFSSSPRSPKDETLYYVVLDRFMNGDKSNDAPVKEPDVHPLNNYMGGDIAGLTQMIEADYFNKLGVTTLWISPPYDQPDIAYKDSKPPYRKLTGYHGYWPTDMRNTESRWGTMDEFKTMVAEAHEHNLAVIIDFVSNHLHESNPMVKLHPDWFSKLELPDGTKNIRLYDAHPFTTWFDDFLPDIAYDQAPGAVDYMTDTEVWWIKQTHADGFRHDAVKHVPLVFWETSSQKLRDEVTLPEHKRLYQVGETVSNRTTINQFIGPKLLDGQFDFPLFWTIMDSLAWEKSDMKVLAKSLQDSVDQYSPGAIMSPFLGNHDVPRFMGCAEGDNKPNKQDEAEEDSFTNPAHVDDPMSYEKLKIAFSFLLGLPGAPMVYYGDEIGMTGSGRPDARRFFIPPAEWNDSNKGTYTVVQNLLRARNESIALRRGGYQELFSDPENIVFARIAPEEVAIVAIQRHAKGGTLSIPLPQAWGKPSTFQALSLDGLTASDASLNENGILEITSKSYTSGVWRLRW
ncbi:hypothetical protein BH09SUM1_BH09SUM1_00380 [soil metagenome]